MRKYYRKVRDYEAAYLEGNKAGKAIENAVKKYKSHRRAHVFRLSAVLDIYHYVLLLKTCDKVWF